MWRERAALLVVMTFAGAAAYEAAVALEWVPLGRDPGEDAQGQAVVSVLSLVAIAATLVLAVLRARWPFALIPLAAGCWVTAHFYAFDPYYLPTRRRFSESGSLSPLWVYGMLVAGALVALLAYRRRRAGWLLAPCFVLACLLTVIGMGIGH